MDLSSFLFPPKNPQVQPAQSPEEKVSKLMPREPEVVRPEPASIVKPVNAQSQVAELAQNSPAKQMQTAAKINCEQYLISQESEENKRLSKLGWKDWFLQRKYTFPAWVVWSFIIILLIFIIIVIVFSEIARAESDKDREQRILQKYGITPEKFQNKYYDPYGGGLRFFQSRDDTGSPGFTLEERQAGGEKLVIEPLTSAPESPNISEYYGIEANLKNGSVMIERENFENSALGIDDLMKANKGM